LIYLDFVMNSKIHWNEVNVGVLRNTSFVEHMLLVDGKGYRRGKGCRHRGSSLRNAGAEARCRVRPGGKRASRREVPTAHTRGLYTTKMTADSTRDRIVYLHTSPAPSNFENASNTINSSFQRVSHDSGTYTRALIQQYTRPQPVTYVHLVWYISSRYSSAQRRVTMYIHPRYHLPAANPHKSCMGLHICRSEVPGVEEYE
jgi:hypothetical protein